MVMIDQPEYYLCREVQQRALAQQATRDDTREFHSELADRYAAFRRQVTGD